MKRTYMTALVLLALVPMADGAYASELQSLKNLERERAELINSFRDVDLDTDGRYTRVQAQTQRLVDLERVVLRDDRLLGHKDHLVRRTFADYDLSFLVHASAEAGTVPVAHWMDRLGFDTGSVMSASRGRR